MSHAVLLKALAGLLVAAGAAFLGVALLGFDVFIALLERYVSDDGHLKDSTRVMLELRLYGLAALCVAAGAFALACSRESFRRSARAFLTYDPASPHLPAPGRVLGVITLVVVVLLLMSLLGQYLRYIAEAGDTRYGLFVYRYFNLDREHWVPTTFSALLLVYCAVLLAVVTRRKHRLGEAYVPHWAVLSVGFAYLAYDEKYRVHEWVFQFLRPYVDSGLPVFWVVPASIIVLIVGLLYVRFLFHLPPVTRLLFVLGGLLYLGGAIGWEIVGRAYALEHGVDNFAYEQLANIEETFEMMGAAVFIFALQSYLRGQPAAAYRQAVTA